MNRILPFLAMVFAAALNPSAAPAADPDFHGSHRDWDVFTRTEGGEKTCYIVSAPKKTLPRGANRGDIYVMVSRKPARRIDNEVMIDVGYPLKEKSRVTANIDGKRYQMFTQDDAAWNYDYDADDAMVASMKRGANLVVSGTSKRGTDTTDTYSLMGFTAAYNEMARRCR